MKKYVYRVTFQTKKGGFKNWAIDIEADNQKEAKETCKEVWYKNHPEIHAFGITVRKLSESEELEYNYFKMKLCSKSKRNLILSKEKHSPHN